MRTIDIRCLNMRMMHICGIGRIHILLMFGRPPNAHLIHSPRDPDDGL